MMDNTIIDIAISLVFVFFLYSLFCSALFELIAGLFNFRANMLKRGIEQMLDGRNYHYFFWERIANWIVYWISRKRHSLSKNEGGFGMFSSYVGRESQSLIGYAGSKISKKDFFSRDVTVEKILPSASEIDGFQKVRKLRRFKLDKKAELFSSMIISHPLYRRSAGSSNLSKDPTYLSASQFSDILIDVLGHQMSPNRPDGPILLREIDANLNNFNKSPSGDIKDVLKIYLEQSNGDLQRFKWLIEIWFDDQMERIVGWYKRQVSYLMLGIGLIVSLIYNVDTIEMSNKLQNDARLASTMADGASRYVNGKRGSSDKSLITTKLDSLYSIGLTTSSTLMGLGWGTYGKDINSINLRIQKEKAILSKIIADRKFEIDSMSYKQTRAAILSLEDEATISVTEKVRYIFSKLSTLKIIGMIITSICVSFGSQFWFDLLIKLVNLRSAGQKPEARPQKSDLRTPNLNRHPDPDSFG